METHVREKGLSMKRAALCLAGWIALAGLALGAGIDLKTVDDSTPLTVGLFSQIAEATLPSVVSITIHLKLGEEDLQEIKRLREFKDKPGEHLDDPDYQPFMDRFFDPSFRKFEDFFDSPENIPLSSGAGVIYDAQGHIITNKHVLGDEKQRGDIEVKLYDGRTFRGEKVKVLSSSDLADLAVLQIEAPNLKPARFGDSDKARIAEPVLALGHPLELVNSVSEGIISGKGRDIQKTVMEKYLQTTAMINPGNSGGALVNMRGEVIGINVAIATNTQRWQGIGFAVPSKMVVEVVNNLIKSGREGFGYLGVRMIQDSPLDQRLEFLNWHGLKDGVVVEAPEKGGPAEKAGVKPNDIVVEVDGVKVTDNAKLIGAVAARPIGNVVALAIKRPDAQGNLQDVKVQVTLGSRPSLKEIKNAGEQENMRNKLLGLGIGETEEKSGPLGIECEPAPDGLKVARVAPGSPAARAGLQAGDLILQVNYLPVRTAADLTKATTVSETRAHHIVRFKRQGVELWRMVEVAKGKKPKANRDKPE